LEAVCQDVFTTFVTSCRRGRIVVSAQRWHRFTSDRGHAPQGCADDVLCYTYGGPKQYRVPLQPASCAGVGLRVEVFRAHARILGSMDGKPGNAELLAILREGIRHGLPMELPAVLSLVNEKAVSSDPVFFPGHSLDMPAGSKILRGFPQGESGADQIDVAQLTFSENYGLWNTDALSESIRSALLIRCICSHAIPLTAATPIRSRGTRCGTPKTGRRSTS